MIEDIVNENIDQFRCFWLDLENKLKYIDLFKRGITSGDTLGLFFIKDSKAVLELVNYYKDFKKIIIYDAKGTINLLKDYDSIDEFNDPRVEYVYVGQDLPMKFDKIIMNPPYSLGNKITEAVLSSLNDDGDCVCLQPLSQYKKKELFRHVETFELADPKLFEDAVITENLSICTLRKYIIDKYSWQDLVLASCDQAFRLFYEWNIEHVCGYSPSRDDRVTRADVNTDVDFIEGYLLYTKHGGGFTTRGFGYRYNIELSKDEFPTSGKLHIKFSNKKGKDNFCKYAYNYNGDKSRALSTKTILGCNSKAASNTYYFSIPQIDWSNIHINQKELWDKGLYDEAVLSEMSLKWNEDKTVIIKDE